MRCGAVVPAAGRATRFGDGDKTLAALAGRPLLEWTLRALATSGQISRIVIAVSSLNQAATVDLIAGLRLTVPVTTVPGGERRMDSVAAGLKLLDDETDLVLVHDAARPLLTAELIERTINAAREHGAAIPGIPVTDTIKRVQSDQVVGTVDRAGLAAVQTPQVFRREWLRAAYDALDDSAEATDDASILEAAGYPVRLVAGDPANLKVTTPVDTSIAEALLRAREPSL